MIIARCLCEYLKPVNNSTQIIILQHPKESKHPLNTVKILTKSLVKIIIFSGEDFSQHQELNLILDNSENKVVLLFPEIDRQVKTSLDVATTTHLVLIDGPWRKAKKIYFLSRNLHSLQRLSLENSKISNYRIRQSHQKNGLSSLEASLEALKLIEPNLNTNSLELAFQKMIDFQIDKMGQAVFNANYIQKKSEE